MEGNSYDHQHQEVKTGWVHTAEAEWVRVACHTFKELCLVGKAFELEAFGNQVGGLKLQQKVEGCRDIKAVNAIASCGFHDHDGYRDDFFLIYQVNFHIDDCDVLIDLVFLSKVLFQF